MKIFWTQQQNEIILLRCDTDQQRIILPEQINSLPITKIESYAFSSKRIDYPHAQILEISNCSAHQAFAIQEITIPATVREIGAYAFYNCESLKQLTVSQILESIGAETFMNCKSLHTLICHGAIEKMKALRGILREYDGELYVHQKNDRPLSLLFPAYDEDHEEISAPHTFHYRIQGSGFVYRQSFEQSYFSFSLYDRALNRLLQTHEFLTASKIALLRLFSDYSLAPSAKELYQTVLKDHHQDLLFYLIDEKLTHLLHFLCTQIELDPQVFHLACTHARKIQNTQSLALLLSKTNEKKSTEPNFDL